MKVLLDIDEEELMRQCFAEEANADEGDEEPDMQPWLVAYLSTLRTALAVEQESAMEIEKLPSGKFRVVRQFNYSPDLAARVAQYVLREWPRGVQPPSDAMVREHVTVLTRKGNGNALKALSAALRKSE